MSCGVGHRCWSDLVLLWLCLWPAATAPILPLAWELPCATSAALKKKKKEWDGESYSSRLSNTVIFKTTLFTWFFAQKSGSKFKKLNEEGNRREFQVKKKGAHFYHLTILLILAKIHVLFHADLLI